MALKRVWPIPFAVMAGGFVAYWFWLRPVQAGANLPEITASVSRGLCDAPFSVKLAAASEDAVIRYTLDGTEPTLRNGALYSSPLRISKTTLLRAAAFKERARVSAVTTHSYLFLDQILHQPKEPPGFPSGPRAWNGMPSAYQMDARVVNDPAYHERMREAINSN